MKKVIISFLMLISSILITPHITAMEEVDGTVDEEMNTKESTTEQDFETVRKELFQAHEARKARHKSDTQIKKTSRKRKRERSESGPRIASIDDIKKKTPTEPKKEKEVDTTLSSAIQLYFGNPLPAIKSLFEADQQQKTIPQGEDVETKVLPTKKRRTEYKPIKPPQQKRNDQKIKNFLAAIKDDPLFSQYADKMAIKKIGNRNVVDFSECKDEFDNGVLHLLVMHHHDVKKNYTNLLGEALILGADTNEQNRFGHTPLWLATYQKKTSLIWMILSPQVMINPNLNLSGYVPNYKRTYLGLGGIDIVKEVDTTKDPMNVLDLIDKILSSYTEAINTAEQSWFPWNKLKQLKTEQESYVGIQKMLKTNGAQNNSLKLTPLHQAVQNNDLAKVKQFIKAGHNPEIQDAQGRKPIDLAEQDSEIFKLLSQEKQDPQTVSPMEQ